MTWLDIRTGRPVRTVAVERSSGLWGNTAVSLDEATAATVAYDTCQRLQNPGPMHRRIETRAPCTPKCCGVGSETR